MTADQPSPALAEAREIVRGMTAGSYRFLCKRRRNELDFPSAIIIGPDVRNAVALIPFTANREARADTDAAGIVRALALLRTVVAEETVTQARPAVAEAYETFGQQGGLRTAGLKPEHYDAITSAVLAALLEQAGEGT